MGFGKQFEQKAIKSMKHNYVRFINLKDMLSAMKTNGTVETDRKEFAKNYRLEVDRLSRFVSSTNESIWMRIDTIGNELPIDASDPNAQKISAYRIIDIEKDIDALGTDILNLRDFLSENSQAFDVLSKKFDKVLSDHGFGEGNLTAEDFDMQCVRVEQEVETFLVFLSDLYARARRVKSNKEGGDAIWVPPETFERKTTKYWVKSEDLLKVKFEIIKHLPLLIFGRKQGADDEKKQALRFVTGNNEILRDSQKISSVYFDSPELHVYHDRLMRHDGASLLRIRWYGERSQSPDFPTFIERKVHREFWTGKKSVKERCGIEQQYLNSVLYKKDLPPETNRDDKNGDFLSEVQAFLNKKGEKQQPMVRTQYQRSAFQEATNNAVRISIDADLKMVREANAPKKSGDWCRDMSKTIQPLDIINFPYAVLEVKLQDEPAEWVTNLTDSNMLIAVPKFSKFQHGMALLYPTKLRNSPWWFLPNADGKKGMSPATFEEMADTGDPYLQQANPALFGEAKHGQAPAAVSEYPSALETVTVDVNNNQKECWNSQDKQLDSSVLGKSSCKFTKGDTMKSFNKVVKSFFVSNSDEPNEYHITCLPIQKLTSRRSSNASDIQKMKADQIEPMTTPRAAAIVRTRIEPKTFFANERTFLSWLQVSVIVIFMAFSLMEGGAVGSPFSGSKSSEKTNIQLHASQVSGALLAPVGIAFMAYALYMHRMRTMQILRRETVRFDDQRGPVMMVCGLVVACIIAYGIALSGIIAN